MMIVRTGQVWVYTIEREVEKILLVVGPPKQGGIAETRAFPAPVLMLHPCVDLATGKQFSGREWTDDVWEDRMSRIA